MSKFKEMDIRCPICLAEEPDIRFMYLDRCGTVLGCNNCVADLTFGEYENRFRKKEKSDYESYIIDKGMGKA